MITEANYIELMKNCSKWNARTSNERRARFRYPFYDQQTGTAQRLNPSYYRLKEQRYYCKDPNTVLQYAAPRWRRKGGAPSDAIEMKMFLRDNPALDAAVNSANHIPTQNSDFLSADISNDSFGTSKGTPKPSAFEEFNEDLDEDLSGDDGGSDEDDWAAKRKGRKSIGKSKKKGVARNTKASRV